jgi:hypothetical protein
LFFLNFESFQDGFAPPADELNGNDEEHNGNGEDNGADEEF